MIIVNETEKFIDDHLSNDSSSDQPFFAYLPLGAGKFLSSETIYDESSHQTQYMNIVIIIYVCSAQTSFTTIQVH